tara:strand:+ start:286 stop:654 length:369 start_codon:yes stop_codon:yes gene_type:complete
MDGNIGILGMICGWPIGMKLGLWFLSVTATTPVAVPAHLRLVDRFRVKLLLAAWALWEILRLIQRMWRAVSFWAVVVYRHDPVRPGCRNPRELHRSVAPLTVFSAALVGMLASARLTRSIEN